MQKYFVAAAAVALASGVHAAPTPSGGTLTDNGEIIEFTGGPFVAANASDANGDGSVTCQEPVLPCDDFELTIDLPEGYVSVYPNAIVRIVTGLTDEGANVREDIDLYMYDTDGNLVDLSLSEGSVEAIGFLANDGVTERVVRVIPFTAFASSYKATIQLIPGEPIEGADTGEGEEGETKQGGIDRSLQSSNYGGTGAAGFTLLALGLLGLRRRRG